VELDCIVNDPVRRRWRILSKALETVPFEEALRLARSVEDFLLAGGVGVPSVIDDPRHLVGASAIGNADAPSNRQPLNAECATAATEAAAGPGEGHGNTGAHQPSEDTTDNDDPVTAPVVSPSLGGDLAALASGDDIVRYLRQRDDVVVREGDTYLVNGRFRESLGQLAERANRMRSRQGLPPFLLMPTDLASGDTSNAAKQLLSVDALASMHRTAKSSAARAHGSPK
jgi:hypothetical protein